MRYSVILEPDEERRGYTVKVPALPGCVTQGRTKAEALSNAREAILGYIEALNKAGEAVPRQKRQIQLSQVTISKPS